MLAAAFTINYLVHLQENPLTGRMRFISLTHDQIMAIASFEEDSVSLKHESDIGLWGPGWTCGGGAKGASALIKHC